VQAGFLKSAWREHNLAPDVLALAAVLDQAWPDIVLSVAVTSEQLRSNLAALDIVFDTMLHGACAS